MQTIEQFIEAEMAGKIARKKNSPLPYLLVLAIGVGLLVLLRTVPLSDPLTATCLTFALVSLALGLILTAMSFSGAMSHYVYLPTGSRMKEKKVYVSIDDYKELAAAFAEGDMQKLKGIQPVVSSNSALNVVASRDGACALVQGGRYDTGHFEAETPVVCLSGTDVAAIRMICK